MAVIEAPFQWDDVGSWRALERLRDTDKAGNVVDAERHVLLDTTGSTIRCDDPKHVVVTLGVEDLIVVVTPNATLVANKHDTFAYASSSTMLNLAAKDAPVISVATIDATGADACLCRPDSGVKEIKDLEGKQVMTTAAASVNTFFPVALKNAGVDAGKVKIVNVAEAALVPSYLQNKAPCILGGIDDKPAEIKANGGEDPVIFNYAHYGVYQPGYSIVAHKDLVKDNPDLVRRFVKATLQATAAAQANPDECIDSLVNWAGEAAVERKQARQVLDVTLSILISPNNTQKKLGLNVEKDWASAMELFKEYKDLETDKKPTDFFTNEFID